MWKPRLNQPGTPEPDVTANGTPLDVTRCRGDGVGLPTVESAVVGVVVTAVA